jgi:hypothetical protein
MLVGIITVIMIIINGLKSERSTSVRTKQTNKSTNKQTCKAIVNDNGMTDWKNGKLKNDRMTEEQSGNEDCLAEWSKAPVSDNGPKRVWLWVPEQLFLKLLKIFGIFLIERK